MNKLYFYIFLIISCALGLWVLSPYLNLIFFSFIVVNFFYPIFIAIKKRVKNPHIATLFTLIIIFILCAIPFSFIFNIAEKQIQLIYKDITNFVSGHDISNTFETLITQINYILSRIPFNDYRVTSDSIKAVVQENIRPVVNYALNFSLNFGATVIKIFPLIIVFAFVLWSSFADYDKFIGFLKQISPLPDDLDELYLTRITAMTNAMVRGTFLIALIQGSVAALILMALGVPYVFLWWILMVFFSIIPLGAGFVTLPIAIIQILLGNYVGGILLLIAQFFFISHIDNILRPYLVQRDAELHPILLLLSILGGIQMFGVFGFIYGPIIMIVIKTTTEVYVKYYPIKASKLAHKGKKAI